MPSSGSGVMLGTFSPSGPFGVSASLRSSSLGAREIAPRVALAAVAQALDQIDAPVSMGVGGPGVTPKRGAPRPPSRRSALGRQACGALRYPRRAKIEANPVGASPISSNSDLTKQ